jgi:hypothetical protein
MHDSYGWKEANGLDLELAAAAKKNAIAPPQTAIRNGPHLR